MASSAPSRRARRRLQIVVSVAAAGIALVVLYLVRDALAAFVLGALLAFLINPGVDWLENHHVPRAAAIALIFTALLIGVAALGSVFVPLLTTEIQQLQAQAPAIANQAQQRLTQLQGQPVEIFGFRVDWTTYVDNIDRQAGAFLLGQFGNALSIGLAAINVLLQILLMLIVAFLMSLEAHQIADFTRRLVPPDYRDDYDALRPKVKAMLRSYLRGQLTIAAIIGVAVGVTLALEGVPFAFALGVLAGITALVPFVGPFIGAVPIVLVGLSVSPLKAILVAASYFLIANFVLQFLYPRIVGAAVHLPALVVIVAFIAGFSFAGILGMFIAIPVAATIAIVFEHIYPRVYGSQA